MSRWDPASEPERKAHPKARGYDMIKDVIRGNCPCGKWLIVLPTYTKEVPLECDGPCHSEVKCGRRFYIENREVVTVNPDE